MTLYRTQNPATEELLRTYPSATWRDAEAEAAATREYFRQWKGVDVEERGRLFLILAKLLRDGKERLARLITEEMGKPIVQAEREIEKCAWGAEFYARQAASFLKQEVIASDAGASLVRFDPIGAVLAIMPWNFPFWQVIRCAAPAMMAGNVVLLKHAPNVPGCSAAIEDLFRKAGFSEPAFQSLFLTNEDAARLIESPYVQAVSVTGSDRAGSQIASVAGRAIKKTVMELGGSDPFIVLEDADLGLAAAEAVRSRMLNAGQSCIAAKRMVVVEPVAPAFEKALTAEVRKQRVGDPLDRKTDIGPLARQDLLENLIRQIDLSKRAGARLLAGGERPPGKGFYYLPTVLADVRPGMPVFDEETFGPVASVIRVRDEAEALEFANKTSYGLGASVWSRDTGKAERLAGEIEAGSVFINGMVHSDPRLPFGGVKRSGYGRELSSYGMREFTNIKTVWVAGPSRSGRS